MILFRLIKIIMLSITLVPTFNILASGGSGGACATSETSASFSPAGSQSYRKRERSQRKRVQFQQPSSDQKYRQNTLAHRTAQKAQLAAPARTKTAIPQEEYDEATSYAAELTQTDLEPIKQFDSSRPEFRAPNLTKRSVVGGLATGAVLGGGTAAAIAKSENSPSWLKWALAGIGAGALVGALAGYARALYHPKVVSHERARKTANDFNEQGCAANDNLEGAEAWHEHYRMHGTHAFASPTTNPEYNSHVHNKIITRASGNSYARIVAPLHVAAGNGSSKVLNFMGKNLNNDELYSDSDSSSESESDVSDESYDDEACKPAKIISQKWKDKAPTEIDQKSENLFAVYHPYPFRTPLCWALAGNHPEAAAILLKYGANHTIDCDDAEIKDSSSLLASQDLTVQVKLAQKNQYPLFRNCKQLQEEIVKRKDLYAALFPAARPVGQSYANADLGILRPPPTVSSISREQRAQGIHFADQAIAGTHDYSSRTS